MDTPMSDTKHFWIKLINNELFQILSSYSLTLYIWNVHFIKSI